MPEDRPSPWFRPEQPNPPPGWTSLAPHPSAPYAATQTAGPLQAGYGVPPVQVHLITSAAPGRRLAVAGVVLASIAVVLAVVALVLGGVSAFAGNSGGGYGLHGTIAAVTGGALPGSALAAEVATKVFEDGGDPEGINCPATVKIAQDVTTVCHGSDYGQDATFLVFFEDADGAYTLLEI